MVEMLATQVCLCKTLQQQLHFSPLRGQYLGWVGCLLISGTQGWQKSGTVPLIFLWSEAGSTRKEFIPVWEFEAGCLGNLLQKQLFLISGREKFAILCIIPKHTIQQQALRHHCTKQFFVLCVPKDLILGSCPKNKPLTVNKTEKLLEERSPFR